MRFQKYRGMPKEKIQPTILAISHAYFYKHIQHLLKFQKKIMWINYSFTKQGCEKRNVSVAKVREMTYSLRIKKEKKCVVVLKGEE